MTAWGMAFGYFTACGLITLLLACIAREFRLIFAFYLLCWFCVLAWHHSEWFEAWRLL